MLCPKIPESLESEYDVDELESVESDAGFSGYASNNLNSMSFLPGKDEFSGQSLHSNMLSSKRILVRGPSDLGLGEKPGNPEDLQTGVGRTDLLGGNKKFDFEQRPGKLGNSPDRRGKVSTPLGKGFAFGLRLQPVETVGGRVDADPSRSSTDLRSRRQMRKIGTISSILAEEDNLTDLLAFITKEVTRQRTNALAFEKVVKERESDSDSEDSSSQPGELERNTQLNHLLVEEDHSNADSDDEESIGEHAVKSSQLQKRPNHSEFRFARTSSFNPEPRKEAAAKDANSRKELSQIYEKEESASLNMSHAYQGSEKNIVQKSQVLSGSGADSIIIKARSVTSDLPVQESQFYKQSEAMNSRKGEPDRIGGLISPERAVYKSGTEIGGSQDDFRKALSVNSEKSSSQSVKTRKNAKLGEAAMKEFALNSSHRTIKLNEAKGLKQLNSMLILDEDIPKTPESPLAKLMAAKEINFDKAGKSEAAVSKKRNLPHLCFGGVGSSNIEVEFEPQNPDSKLSIPKGKKIWESQHEYTSPMVQLKGLVDSAKGNNTSEAQDKKEPAVGVASASKDKAAARRRRSSVQVDGLALGQKARDRLAKGRKDLLFDNLKQNIRNHFQLPNRVKTFEFKRTEIEEIPDESTLINFNTFKIPEFSLEKRRFLQQLTVRIFSYDNVIVVFVNPRIMINSLIQLLLCSLPSELLEKAKIYHQLPQLYELKTPDVFNPRRPESLLGALNRKDELISQLKLLQRYQADSNLE